MGPEGHYWVTARAIDSLEGRLKEFYSEQSASIIEHSVDADYRKSKDPEERFRHYVDLDRYGLVPFRGFDLDYDVLVKKHGSDQVQKNGLVLWTAEKTFRDLVNAFKTENREEIVRNSSDLAHYIGDLHQPLHTAENYNGQFTGQHGIHYRFELDLLDLHLKKVHFQPARPKDLGPVLEALYAMALESFMWVDNILVADQKLVATQGINRSEFPSRTAGRKRYPDRYYAALFDEVGFIVERQLNQSAHALACLWWMAWQKAGKPAF